MKFIDEDFLLKGSVARNLYHDYAENLPIIDYHCHLSPKEIAENRATKNIGEFFLKNDHYKWRIMRSNGIEERFITGSAEYYEKFKKFASCMPYCVGNPILHWTHLELKRYFGINDFLDNNSADDIWNSANEHIDNNSITPWSIIKKSNVQVICTTDDPADNLMYHSNLSKSNCSAKVLPTFRPDKLLEIKNDEFVGYISGLGINSYSDLESWVENRIIYFNSCGCKLADHSFEKIPSCVCGEADIVFEKRMNNKEITEFEENCFKTALLNKCMVQYNKYGWTVQLHIGALRNNNTTMLKIIGTDAGFDSMNDMNIAESLSAFLDYFESKDILPKTIIYNLNPKDNYVVGTMVGNFQKHPIPSKIQYGPAWWFNDQKDGIEMQLQAIGNLGILGRFVGMLTDSRSFLSYTRHEYFRRILCNLIGTWVEDGLYPNDKLLLKKLIEGICYLNAKEYFSF